jgi:glycerol-3-phosphate acyltransferase PlsY
MEWMVTLAWVLFSFFCGSLPFSVWIGRWILKVDIRQFGDSNPGTANVFRAGGRGWGVLAMLMDFLKGAVPVGIAKLVGELGNWEMALVAIAPVLGHAFSPFLGFRGGKALATTFGIWTGLTLWQGPVVLGLNLAFWSGILVGDGWVILLGMTGFLGFLVLGQAATYVLAVGIANAGLLVWRYRQALRIRPNLQKWLVDLFK